MQSDNYKIPEDSVGVEFGDGFKTQFVETQEVDKSAPVPSQDISSEGFFTFDVLAGIFLSVLAFVVIIITISKKLVRVKM